MSQQQNNKMRMTTMMMTNTTKTTSSSLLSGRGGWREKMMQLPAKRKLRKSTTTTTTNERMMTMMANRGRKGNKARDRGDKKKGRAWTLQHAKKQKKTMKKMKQKKKMGSRGKKRGRNMMVRATPKPTPFPTHTMGQTSTPTIAPTIQPTPQVPVGTISCVPTTGTCLDNMDDLIAVVNQAQPNDVIALCGQEAGVTLNPVEPLVLSQPNLTLCCESSSSSRHDNDDCTLGTTGGNLLVQVVTESVTIANIFFQDGGGPSRGSQLDIVENGSHIIEDCTFVSGQGDGLAQVFVDTFGSLNVRRSSFRNGLRGTGVGLWVQNAEFVLVEDSEFTDNDMAGLYLFWNSLQHDLLSEGQNIWVENSTFSGNGAEGIFSSNLGTLPHLRLLQSTFLDNDREAGTLCCTDFDEYGTLVISGNDGSNNNNGGEACTGFFFWDECIDVDMEIMQQT